MLPNLATISFRHLIEFNHKGGRWKCNMLLHLPWCTYA